MDENSRPEGLYDELVTSKVERDLARLLGGSMSAEYREVGNAEAYRMRVDPTEVDCFYQVVRPGRCHRVVTSLNRHADNDGQSYLHLSSFGSDSRISHPKSSQSLQLNQSVAQELIRVLRETFPGVS
ncbi:hypothetical protein [Aestuariimicrobium sp. T2.26MG-19.2B]|uniref:hypothetical protein n=1 Tax=Aestuariimicrobium sp. T2.26MG-19.2B TaxID=3040679 RepID=UPI0024777A05|nr:hypothetical protein [Aestuariimicrobium sp. T2.26MG-19.2B]CAI9405088.1 hypothetical protein AESSP_01341 [Aestuariimicrobium sp. T2.26MG-19.2B]